jgi:serine/threonine-protein kinase
MAEVWKARQISLDRVVAIKMLTHQALPDAETLDRFHTEARAAAKVNHPGIVQVHDAGEQNGAPYYVMEYVEGKTVGDLLEEQGHVPEENALIVAECVALALAHAWNKARIIHCDIKPDNVLVARDGTIKIADLGLARIFGARQSDEGADQILGTPNYTSPEQAEGVEPLDCRSDIYSLGAMLYHLVTGTIPFRGSRGSAAMDLHVAAFLPDPLELRAELKPTTAWLIEKMMVKDRNLRLQNWEDVLADIRAVKAGRMPAGPYPEPGQSTVGRSSARGAPAEKPGIAPGKRTLAGAPDREKKTIVVAKEDLGKAAAPATSSAGGLREALVTLVLLALVAGGVYAAIFTLARPPGTPASPAESSVREMIDQIGESQPLPPAEEDDLPPRTIKLSREESRRILEGADESVRNDFSSSDPLEDPPADGEVIDWQDSDFLRGATLYNTALAAFTAFQKERSDPTALMNAERDAREAIRLFQSCQTRAPRGFHMQKLIDDCYHLISDIRHSTLIKAP